MRAESEASFTTITLAEGLQSLSLKDYTSSIALCGTLYPNFYMLKQKLDIPQLSFSHYSNFCFSFFLILLLDAWGSRCGKNNLLPG